MPEARKTVGRVEITSLSDGGFDSSVSSIYASVPSSAWTPFHGIDVTPEGMLHMNVGCYLLRTPRLVVLVDTGVGGGLLKDLEGHGVRPEEVQLVTHTHLHGDHIAWNISGAGAEACPTFPNARYAVPRGDWDYFVEPASPGYNRSVEAKFLLLKQRGLVELVDDGHKLSPELTVWATPGHTPGHSSIVVESGGQRAVVVGDALIHPIEVAHPDWQSSFNQDPVKAIETRWKLLDRMEQEGSLGAVSHFFAPGFGRVAREGGSRVWRRE